MPANVETAKLIAQEQKDSINFQIETLKSKLSEIEGARTDLFEKGIKKRVTAISKACLDSKRALQTIRVSLKSIRGQIKKK